MLLKHWVDDADNFSGILGKYSLPEAMAFSQCNLERDIEIIAEPSSWMPRTDLEVRQDFVNFLTVGGLPMGFLNPAFPQEVKERASELFRFDISFDKIEPDIRWANLRLEQLEETIIKLKQRGFVQGNETDEAVINKVVMDIPIDLYIDTHEVYVDQYTKFLKTDKGIYADKLTKSAIQYLILQHQNAIKTLKDELNDEIVEDVANQATTEGAMGVVAGAGQEEETAPQQSQEPEIPPAEPVDVGTGRETSTERPTSRSSKVEPQEARK